jgi:hypothetical protein
VLNIVEQSIRMEAYVYIYVHNTITYNNILFEKYCVEKDMEVCAVKLTFTNIKIMVLTRGGASLGAKPHLILL